MEERIRAERDVSPKGKWLTLLVVGLSVLMGTIDMSIVNVSQLTPVEELNTDFSTIQWVVLGYVLITTSLMLGVARLGDMHDKKRLYALVVSGYWVANTISSNRH